MSGASHTSPQSDALQWKRYGGRGGYVIPLPQGTTDIVAAYAGYEHTCNLRLYAANGTELYSEPRNEGATSGVPAPAVLSIDPSWHSGGPALLQFDESSDWCYTMYVLVRGNWPPSSPPQPPPPPLAPWAVYCNSPACGDALLAAGWRVLGEWGTLARFGAPPILSHADFLEQGEG